MDVVHYNICSGQADHVAKAIVLVNYLYYADLEKVSSLSSFSPNETFVKLNAVFIDT